MMSYLGYNIGHSGYKWAPNLTIAVRIILMRSAEEKTMTEEGNYIARNNLACKIVIPMIDHIDHIDYKNQETARMENSLEH